MSEFTEDKGMATYEELVHAGNQLADTLLDVMFLARLDGSVDGGMSVAAKPLANWLAVYQRTGFAQVNHLHMAAK